MCSVLMVLALVTVGYGDSTAVQLMGVCFSAVQAGLGESSFLALSAFYDTPRALTAWSSGTGFAGIFGYAWVFLLRSVLGFSFRATLLTASLLALLWLYAYFRLLSPPQASFRVDESIISTTTIGDHTRNGAYSPVSLDNHGCQDIVGADGAGEEDWEGSFGTSIERKISPGDEARAKNMTARERLRFTLGLWRFTVPLMLVYFAEVRDSIGVARFVVLFAPVQVLACLTVPFPGRTEQRLGGHVTASHLPTEILYSWYHAKEVFEAESAPCRRLICALSSTYRNA